jgi:hypothetical protein
MLPNLQGDKKRKSLLQNAKLMRAAADCDFLAANAVPSVAHLTLAISFAF